MKIQRALISCTDKTGLVEFARFLASQNIEILSTGGTAKLLRENGIAAKEVSEHTGSPEILDGRVKTLHPKIHGGLLGLREDAKHQKQMAENHIVPIDLVVVNLYAFEKTVAKDGCTLEEAIENIDIGGPSMLRSAAKNHRYVTVVIDPNDYVRVQNQIAGQGFVDEKTRFELALKVYQATSNYDAAISRYLASQLKTENAKESLDVNLNFSLTKVQDLRYGENPHQKASFYRYTNLAPQGLAQAKQLQGKELSYNNILDTEAAYNCCSEFSEPACVIVKHNNPCGVASAAQLKEAFVNARACDPVSSFGGIVALNRKIDAVTAQIMSETFFEVILAPEYEAEALKIFAAKKNLRVLSLENFSKRTEDALEMRCVSGGILVQDKDRGLVDLRSCPVVTKRKPTEAEWQALAFAWRVCKHVKSNAIVFARETQSIGIGAGQMSRVDSVRIAAWKAKETFQNSDILKGTVLASDAFFPFRDGLENGAQHGITAVAQPGGSVRDEEVIQAANEYNLAMVFTGMRHFRH